MEEFQLSSHGFEIYKRIPYKGHLLSKVTPFFLVSLICE